MNISNIPLEDSSVDFEESMSFTHLDVTTTKVCFAFAGVLGVILNVITIFAIGFGKNIHEAVKVQLINLAVAECIMAAFYPYARTTYQLQESFFSASDAVCGIYMFFAYTAVYASIWCRAAISLERFVVLYFPLRASKYGRKEKFIVIAFVWLIAIVPEVYNSWTAEVIDWYGTLYCLLGNTLDHKTYNIITTTKYLVPVIIIVTSYSFVFVRLCTRKRSNMIRLSSSAEDSDSINKLQTMLVVDAILTVVTWLPYHLHITARSIMPAATTYPRSRFTLELCLLALVLTITFSTPIVYFTFNKYFRIDVWLLFRRMKCWSSLTKTSEKLGGECPVPSATSSEKRKGSNSSYTNETELSGYNRSLSNTGSVNTVEAPANSPTTTKDYSDAVESNI